MLSGNLELFALADVLRFVSRSGATGVVNIYRPADGGRILLVEGQVVGAVVDDLVATDADAVVDAGMRLIDGGAGDFALEIEPVEGPARQAVEEFLTAVGRRRAEWRKILSSVGSLDEPFELSGLVPSGTAEITLTPLEWMIAVHADGRRSLRDIAHEAGASDFSVATALLAMSNAGLVGLHGVEPAADDEDDAVEDEEDGSYEEQDVVSYEEDAGEDEEDDAGSPMPVRSDDDLDPAELLRELGEQRSAPRGRRMAPARPDQRLRLRSR